jgi:ABC-type lipoprotein release transport system permease subunit
MCVTMKPRQNEEAQAHVRLSSHTKKKKSKEKVKIDFKEIGCYAVDWIYLNNFWWQNTEH